MKCQRMFDGNKGILARASCTLLSPKTRWPASTASRTISVGWVLVTAISSMSVTFLPETCAACAISFFTRLRFASILIMASNQSISAWQIQPDDPAVRSLPNLSLGRAGSEIALNDQPQFRYFQFRGLEVSLCAALANERS